MPRRLIPVAAALIALAVPSAAHAAKKPQYYVSLGDSYAAGYQPKLGTTRAGFAYQLVGLAKEHGYNLKLVNFGCGGETTESILERTKKCEGLGPGGAKYAGKTQVAAATKFLKKHRGQIRLVTVSIGGNDVTACAKEADPIGCIGPALEKVKKNGKTLMKRLRAAAGKKARIVGITYPDVILGDWVRGNQDLAKLSVFAFQSLLNPALKDIYESYGAKFVDVTDATGAYTPLETTTDLAPYGTIPVAVANVCELTWFCELGDIHPRKSGYTEIAQLIAATLPHKH